MLIPQSRAAEWQLMKSHPWKSTTGHVVSWHRQNILDKEAKNFTHIKCMEKQKHIHKQEVRQSYFFNPGERVGLQSSTGLQ